MRRAGTIRRLRSSEAGTCLGPLSSPASRSQFLTFLLSLNHLSSGSDLSEGEEWAGGRTKFTVKRREGAQLQEVAEGRATGSPHTDLGSSSPSVSCSLIRPERPQPKKAYLQKNTCFSVPPTWQMRPFNPPCPSCSPGPAAR